MMMNIPKQKQRHFTAFRSVSEEMAVLRAADQWVNEGGNALALSGYIVSTPDSELAYKVMLHHDHGPDTAHSYNTIEECEAFVGRNTYNGLSSDPSGQLYASRSESTTFSRDPARTIEHTFIADRAHILLPLALTVLVIIGGAMMAFSA